MADNPARTALHLRSTLHPQFTLTRRGRVFVETECGQRMDAMLVDNEASSCPLCNALNEQLAIR